MGRLDARVALITGGGRGIGRAIALEMAREGADIVVTSRTQEQLDAVVAEAGGLGRRGLALRADAMDRTQVQDSVRAAIDHFGRLDILVNNVGGGTVRHGPEDMDFLAHDDDVFVDNLTLNLVTHYWAARIALPHMRERGYGRVINIGSGYAKRSGGPLAYSAAKHGLVGYTKAMAAAVAPYGITVNCLCPGWTNTQLVDLNVLAATFGVDVDEARRRIASENLQNRIVEPEELGPMAALLAAPEAGAITGQVISVDGGYKV